MNTKIELFTNHTTDVGKRNLRVNQSKGMESGVIIHETRANKTNNSLSNFYHKDLYGNNQEKQFLDLESDSNYQDILPKVNSKSNKKYKKIPVESTNNPKEPIVRNSAESDIKHEKQGNKKYFKKQNSSQNVFSKDSSNSNKKFRKTPVKPMNNPEERIITNCAVSDIKCDKEINKGHLINQNNLGKNNTKQHNINTNNTLRNFAKKKAGIRKRIKKLDQELTQSEGMDWSEESEVLICETKTNQTNNRSNFCDISHKDSFGANNWKKFLELSLEPQNNSQNILPKANNDSNKKYGKTPVEPTNNPKEQVLKLYTNSADSTIKYDKQGNKRYFKKQNNSEEQNIKKCSSHVSPQLRDSRNILSLKTFQGIKKPILTKQIALDCEMVGVEIGINKSMLARVSLVNAHEDCIYDKYVIPTEPVVDYRTRFSGIRPKDLENATDFKIVQKEVADIINKKVLVGHALKHDLNVLFLTHPKHLIRDTSRYPKFREGRTPALKKLAKKYLGVSIQEGEHSSVQDALAAMQLYRMFRKEWEDWVKKKPNLQKKKKKQSVKMTTTMGHSAMDI